MTWTKCTVCGVESKLEYQIQLNGKTFCSEECLEEYVQEVDN